jgi:methylenetetrahydrofolate reductase (NADPH)
VSEQHNPPIESRLVRSLLEGRFALTVELVPPVAGSAEAMLDWAVALNSGVQAFNLADSAGGKVHMSGLACAALLKSRGLEPVLQMTCRDRNRVALYSELLGAGALGVHNILMMRGDNLAEGNHPDTKLVHDLNTAELIAAAAGLSVHGALPGGGAKLTDTGILPGQIPVADPPGFFIGAADVPSAISEPWWEDALRAKLNAGAQFIQTQLCYDADQITRYASRLHDSGLADNLFVLIGTGPLKSARSALWMRDNLWGVDVPDRLVERLDEAEDPVDAGIGICAELLDHIANTPGLAGAHLMAPGNLDAIAPAIERAGLSGRDIQSA